MNPPDAPKSNEMAVMIRAARAAGESLLADFARLSSLRVDEKGPSDFVSSADLRAQDIVASALRASFPDHALLLEEGKGGEQAARARFIVDPLDGTTNFLRGLPHFAISIAHEVEGEVVAGLVLDPVKSELFWAERGEGAWLGDLRLAVSRESAFERGVVATGVPHRGRGDHAPYLAALGRVMGEVAGIRRWGAAALDLAYVAAGRFDAFFELGLAPWDMAAGALLVREAGGVITKTTGAPLDLFGADVLASSSERVHARMLSLLEPLHRASVAPAPAPARG